MLSLYSKVRTPPYRCAVSLDSPSYIQFSGRDILFLRDDETMTSTIFFYISKCFLPIKSKIKNKISVLYNVL